MHANFTWTRLQTVAKRSTEAELQLELRAPNLAPAQLTTVVQCCVTAQDTTCSRGQAHEAGDKIYGGVGAATSSGRC